MTVEEIRASLQNSYVREPSRALMISGLAEAIESFAGASGTANQARVTDAARAIQQFARELVEAEEVLIATEEASCL